MSSLHESNKFPYLRPETNKITSPQTRSYNCIAWAAGSTSHWWWPSPLSYWPPGVPVEENIDAFVAAFEMQGYELCDDALHEPDFEKIALFARELEDGSLKPTHAARQLENGNWTSKLGNTEDIEHYMLESVSGPSYGSPVRFLKRKRPA